MDDTWRIRFEAGRPVTAERLVAGAVVESVSGLLTLTEAVARTGKSRRQLYRDVRGGRLRPLGKFSGEWLFPERGLPVPRRRRPPRLIRALFPEYALENIDAERDWKMVASRVLDTGFRDEIRWALGRYGRKRLAGLVREEGRNRLSPRSAALWSLYFRVRAGGRSPPWRERWRKAWDRR